MLRPAGAGTGVIAGSGIRAVMELAGVQNVITKCTVAITHNMIRATMDAIGRYAVLKRWLVAGQDCRELRP